MKPAFRDKIAAVFELDISGEELVSALLSLAGDETVCILDSCGDRHPGSHLLLAGIDPVEVLEVSNESADETLSFLDTKLTEDLASIFTLSYDFGLKMLGFPSRLSSFQTTLEPDVFLARFDVLIIHDYDTSATYLVGDPGKFGAARRKITGSITRRKTDFAAKPVIVTSNFSKAEYLDSIEKIKEQIRAGNTYQTNLTQRLTAVLPDTLSPAIIFERLRRDNSAPFSAFIRRLDSTVVSTSPERFFKISDCESRLSVQLPVNHLGRGVHVDDHNFADERACPTDRRIITTSPIKGTRRRGRTPAEDDLLKRELLESKKDRAENTMIVDLLRNDLGRVSEFGSVRVEKLCELEVHPTLFHLVSTVRGELRPDTSISDVLKAVFPCGSITGAPKISTMQIIDEIETVNRGLSMGAIGYYAPSPWSNVHRSGKPLGFEPWTLDSICDLSVAIRTMVIRENVATFNVGGGIVIDSDPESEYQETLTKAKAILASIGADSDFLGILGPP